MLGITERRAEEGHVTDVELVIEGNTASLIRLKDGTREAPSTVGISSGILDCVG
jgi:hypothetical protein